MAAHTPNLLLASCTGIALTGAFVGISWGLSYLSVPALLLGPPKTSSTASKSQPVSSPDLLARQYQYVFDIGAVVGPVTGVLSASTFIYASQQLPAAARTSKYLLIAAAILNVSVGPFTMIVMAKANNELHRRAAAAEKGEDEIKGRKESPPGGVQTYDTPRLLQWWSTLNAIRGWIQVGAFTCATSALVI
jgi:uncharacterized membrane protein